MQSVATDYLVIGAGASGMAFTDELVARSDAAVILVDRRDRPGGHWNDAYPFVRLHLPSAFYGVNSLPLGTETIDQQGPNAGLYQRATGAEVCDYYGRVLDEQLLPSGQVRFLGMHDYVTGPRGEHLLVSRVTGETQEVTVRRKLVDATYLETEVPATHPPSFEIEEGVSCLPVNELVHLTTPHANYVLVGGGKTAMDACLWLLDNGVDADHIRWIRPRDSWLLDRSGWQPLDQVGSIMEGVSLELEALAAADSVIDLFRRLEASGRLLRLDPDVLPTVYRGASVSQGELTRLRLVRDVIRLGRVLRLESGRIALENGTVDAVPGTLYVDCSARGLGQAPARPIFEEDRITLQQVRSCSPCFNAALIGYLEATREDTVGKNLLCPPNPYPDAAQDWLANVAVTQNAARIWGADPDLAAWLEASRLNLLRGVFDRADEPRVQVAFERYGTHVKRGMVRLKQLLDAPAG